VDLSEEVCCKEGLEVVVGLLLVTRGF